MKNVSSLLGKLMAASVVLLVVVSGIYFYGNYSKLQKENARLANPQAAAQVESSKLTQQVGALIELPANETPTIATVVDASKLSSQAFFANAHNGDKVLLYGQVKKAILYRPSTNKIIEVAPISIGSGATGTTAASGTVTTKN